MELLGSVEYLPRKDKMKKKIDLIEIDQLLDYIHEGKTYREMADLFSVKLSTLADFVGKAEHSARVKSALQLSADTYADKAEQVLIKARGTLVEIQRAKELSQYYKWKASKRSPKVYGDKIDLTSDGKSIVPAQILIKPLDIE